LIPDGSLELISFATLGKVVNLTPARPHGASATSSPRSSGRRRRRQDRRFSPRAAIRDRVRSGRDEIGREVRSSTGLPQPRCVRAVVGAGNQLDIDKLARPAPRRFRVASQMSFVSGPAISVKRRSSVAIIDQFPPALRVVRETKAIGVPGARPMFSTSASGCTRWMGLGNRPIVPSTSAWVAWPLNTIDLPCCTERSAWL
jgi:hypothetical protein